MTILQQIADNLKDINLVNARKPLEKLFRKKDIDFMFHPLPCFMIKYRGNTIVITHKDNITPDEKTIIQNEIAIGFCN